MCRKQRWQNPWPQGAKAFSGSPQIEHPLDGILKCWIGFRGGCLYLTAGAIGGGGGTGGCIGGHGGSGGATGGGAGGDSGGDVADLGSLM